MFKGRHAGCLGFRRSRSVDQCLESWALSQHPNYRDLESCLKTRRPKHRVGPRPRRATSRAHASLNGAYTKAFREDASELL